MHHQHASDVGSNLWFFAFCFYPHARRKSDEKKQWKNAIYLLAITVPVWNFNPPGMHSHKIFQQTNKQTMNRALNNKKKLSCDASMKFRFQFKHHYLKLHSRLNSLVLWRIHNVSLYAIAFVLYVAKTEDLCR